MTALLVILRTFGAVFRGLPWWAWLLLIWAAYTASSSYQLGQARRELVSVRHTQEVVDAQARQSAAVADATIIVSFAGVAKNADTKSKNATADAGLVRAAAERLRTTAAAAPSAVASAPTATATGPAPACTGMVPADVFGWALDTAGALAAEADRARIGHEACAAAYESARQAWAIGDLKK
jgi:Protein of unknown function (DUF2514)